MNRILSLFLFVPIVFVASLYFIYVDFCNKKNELMAQIRLQYTMNYCTDDAIDAVMDVDDLGMDYVDWDKIDINPDLAMDAFVDTFLMNYDYVPNDDLRNMVKLSYMKSFIVCVYDGYYNYTLQQVAPETLDLVSSLKVPYKYTKGGKSYSLNLSNNGAYMFNGKDIVHVKSPLSDEECLGQINGQLSTDLTAQMESLYTHGWTSKLVLPSELTRMESVQAVKTPTVMAIMDDIDIDTGYSLTAFGIAGSALTHLRPIAGYNRNGQLYYCYVDLLPEYVVQTPGYIIESFATVEQAAVKGYHYDPLYME